MLGILLMMKRGVHGLVFLALGVVFAAAAGCTSDAQLSNANELDSFSFQRAQNPGLSADLTATINGNMVVATAPAGTHLTALVATFATTGIHVEVGTTAQVSGTTANDFTNTVSYKITAANGDARIYAVTVTIVPSDASLQ